MDMDQEETTMTAMTAMTAMATMATEEATTVMPDEITMEKHPAQVPVGVPDGEPAPLQDASTAEKHPAQVPAWAERLAQRIRHAHEPPAHDGSRPEEWIPAATALLRAQFDEAVHEANAALERTGLSERIAVRHPADEQAGDEYEYRLTAPAAAGGERFIAVFARLRAVKGQVAGGAQITTSETRATIFLTPSIEGGRLRWLVPHAGTEFTAWVVDDLLLSVFGNDPAATRRLSPLFSVAWDS